MSKIAQIILGADVVLPHTSGDRYSGYEEPLTVQLDMISGRRVSEIRGGKVWKATYSFDYMGDELCRKALAILNSGKPFQAAILPNNSDIMVTSTFLTESLTQPTFAFSRNGKAYWHNLAFTLREVRPHA